MGRKLFGIDIASEVASAIKSAGDVVSMTLVKVTEGTRTAGALTGGTNPTETSYTCRGFLEQKRMTEPGGLAQEVVPLLSILGATLPDGIEPEANDRAVFEGATYQIVDAETDPAGAVWQCKVAEL